MKSVRMMHYDKTMTTPSRDRSFNSRNQALAAQYSRAIFEVIAETLWPTRCAICDLPDELLCANCRLALPYIDLWRACPQCGAPFGNMQCSECNPVALKVLERKTLPFSACVCTTVYSAGAARLITTYKDRGEQRLGPIIADLMAQTIPPAWNRELAAIIAIPSSARALRRRGFDHTEKIANQLSLKTELPSVKAFKRPCSKDQRALSKRERAANMEERFSLCADFPTPKSVLLIDDVLTTGSTLCAASDALHQAGVEEIRCATFARVW